MSLHLSDDDYKRIIGELFLFKSSSSALSKPSNTDDDSVPSNLAARMKPIATNARFKDIAIGVVDFTADRMAPRVWLHNGDDAWRIASTGKTAALLAAVQLRDDVRKIKATGLITTPSDFDELFATVWSKSKNSEIKAIAANDGAPPRISTIFDLTKTPPDFLGADVPLDRSKLSNIGDKHLSWSDVPDLTFWERMWLMGAQSDNVAATSCISEIGIAYMKAVERAYGLFDPRRGMHLLLAGGYAGVNTNTPVSRNAGAPKYRRLRNTEYNRVKDLYINQEGTESYYSNQPGSAAALTAYMIALMQDKLVDTDGCDTIRAHLADEKPDTTTSLILEGVEGIEAVSKAHTKLGILGTLRCEFAYLETINLKFAVLALGIKPKSVGSTRYSEEIQGQDLGKEIHNALEAP